MRFLILFLMLSEGIFYVIEVFPHQRLIVVAFSLFGAVRMSYLIFFVGLGYLGVCVEWKMVKMIYFMFNIYSKGSLKENMAM